MSEAIQTLQLADTGRITTRLGYGCSSLMGALNQRESLSLLENAYAAGIRHFDVAPMYGYGAAEACLGKFLARYPGETTVTTKYGIAPAKNQSLLGFARKLAGPLVRRIPAVKHRLAKAASVVGAPAGKANFTVEEAQASLHCSLRALGVDRIDVWLLHEVEATDLNDERLLRFLEDAAVSGKIGTFGVGSDAHKVEPLLRDRATFCRVVQHEWSVLDPAIVEGAPFRIHHRALTSHFRTLYTALVQDTELCLRWSAEVGAELAQREVLAEIMLKAAFVMNPSSLILASSKNPSHIAANARAASGDILAEPARRLHALVQREGIPAVAGATKVAA